MGALSAMIAEDEGPQAYGATPPFMASPTPSVDMGGLGQIVNQTAKDLQADYQGARDRYEARRPQIDQAGMDVGNSFMEGYDENAYDANAWAQAGIGAATPTLSALESLNRAVAGYSGVKLQQRADLGKRITAEKQAKLESLEKAQQIDAITKKGAPEQLIDLYKAGLISKQRLAAAISDRYVNVPGRGLVDKLALQQGGDGVVVPSFKPTEMLIDMQKEVAKMMEQDKNFHFNSREEYQAMFDKLLQERIAMADQISGGAFSRELNQAGALPQMAPPPAAAPGDTIPNNPELPNVINPGFSPENAEFLKNQVPAPASAVSPIGAPGTVASDAQEGGLPADLANVEQAVQLAATGKAPVQVAANGPVTMPAGEVPPAPAIPAAPWGPYAMAQPPRSKPQNNMFSKVDQEREIARAQQEEKNAENTYNDLSAKAGASASWYDTLRAMESMDLNAAGSFANVRNYAGKLLSSMGYENAEMAKDAKNLSALNAIIMQGIQERLAVQNGVQAKDDATREQQSFAQITDPKQVTKVLIKQAQAKALRVVEQEQFFTAWKENNGTYAGAQNAWNKYIQDTPVFAMYGGQPVYMNQFVDGWMRKNAGAIKEAGMSEAEANQEAVKAWRKISVRKK